MDRFLAENYFVLDNLLLHVHGQEWNSPNSFIFLLLWLIIRFLKMSFKEIQKSTLKKNPLTQVDPLFFLRREKHLGVTF